MHIEHIAIWTSDIARLACFYEHYFQAARGDIYRRAGGGFSSCFLTFPAGARLELMTRPELAQAQDASEAPASGYAHMAFATGSKEKVDQLTARLQHGGYAVIDGPRLTGDGYYESCVLDPDGNRVEITI